MTQLPAGFKVEMLQELEAILEFWQQYSIDEQQGGFVGKIDNDNRIYKHAIKGAVLNSRILWTFAAAYNQLGKNEHLQTAQRAYHYITEYFVDDLYGGVYWSVNADGSVCESKKQVYAIAFALYGLSEYYRATCNEKVKQQAIELYHVIEKYSHDKTRGGYHEAYTRDWKELNDQRLSDKDRNEKKTMNTHLHVLEAYTNLYRIWPGEDLKNNIAALIHIFLDKIIDPATNHLKLFFNENWECNTHIISYGHDIEAAWLLQEAAEVLQDHLLLATVKTRCLKIAAAAENGLDIDGGLWYEKEDTHIVKEKHWWPQAEAIVGFYNAYQVSGNVHYLNRVTASWNFIKQHIIDTKNGEWFWGIKEDHMIMEGEDKVGMWKCPYHNGRACMEMLKRLK